jgi:diacylglycerol kinase (ATP)
VRRRALRIEHRDGTEPPVFGFIMGTGVFNAAIDAGQVAHRFGAFQGLAVGLAATFGMVMALIGIGRGPWRALSPTRIVTAEDGELPRSRHGLVGQRFAAGLSTLTTFPLGMKPFAGANREAGKAIAYLAIDAPLRRVVARVPLILAGAQGRHYPELGIHRGATRELEIELGGRFILDGESFPPGAYRVGLGPELEFLVP